MIAASKDLTGRRREDPREIIDVMLFVIHNQDSDIQWYI